MAEAATLTGNLEVQIGPQGLEASLVFTPREEGPQWDRQKAYTLIEEAGIREGIDAKALQQLFDPQQSGGEQRSVVIARGSEPQEGRPPQLSVEKLSIPEQIQTYEQEVVPADRPPQVFLRKVEKTRRERTVTKKAKLPFLPDKQVTEVVWDRNEQLLPLAQPGQEQGRGYAHTSDVLAAYDPGQKARSGRDVLGRELAAEQSGEGEGPFLSGGLKLTGTEVRAEEAGFYRYGSNWIELIPFTLHEHRVYASENKLSCLLDFHPGSELARPPTAEQILEEAQALGFPGEQLLDPGPLAELLSQALTEGARLTAEPVSRSADAQIRIAIPEDKLSASLTLSKARGKGKPLQLKEVGEAIRSRRFKGLDIPRVQEDILRFFRSEESRLEDYLLVEGKEAERGEDGRIEWHVSFLTEKRLTELKEQAGRSAEKLGEIASLQTFPIEEVECMAEVQEQATIATVVPATAGAAGADVFGMVRPGIKGQDVEVQLFENLKKSGEEIITTMGGVLDRAEQEGKLRLRVRAHQDREIQVFLAEDRMQAFLTLLPSAGSGEPLELEAVYRVIEEAGVVQGLLSEEIAQGVETAKGGEPVQRLLIARGQEPVHGEDTDLEIQVQMASGQRLTVKEDGRADYRNQDIITVVKTGALLAKLNAPTVGTDGWDVTGKALAARRGSARYVHVGKHVESREQSDGSVRYFSKIDGELDYRGGSIDVVQVHSVEGDVGLESGNVNFFGTVRVSGAVQSGFSVVSGESIFVEESVQGALLSAADSIHIEKGIVGEDKAVLRARKSIRARFAEQATLLAVESVHLTNACLRCTVKCNGRIFLESEKGNIIGGRVLCKLGLEAMNIGSEREVATEIHFGQDILVQDQLERESRQAQKLKNRNVDIERSLRHIERTAPGDQQGLMKLHAEKLANLRQLQMHSKRIFILEERFEQHFPSEIRVRGVIYPGVVLKSHGRQREIKNALREVIFFFDTASGRIEEKPLSG